MAVKVSKITEPLVLGEGPHWDDRSQALYLVDIQGHTIHKYVPSTGQHTRTKLDGPVGFIVPVQGTTDQFVVGVGRKFLIVSWDGQEGTPAEVVRELAEVDRGTRNRINDGKADPRGRLFAVTCYSHHEKNIFPRPNGVCYIPGGLYPLEEWARVRTMGHEEPPGNFEAGKGALYRLDGAKVTQLADRIGISNGLAWDLKEKAFYYTDSLERSIRRYDYDVDTGEISNPKHIFDLKKNSIEGFPDGSTIDTDGNLWVAVFDSSCVLKIDPRAGTVLQKVEIPAKQVTSATFGGPNLDILFVTTASMPIGGEEQRPPCGCTFMVTGLGVTGHPNVSVRV